MLHLAGYDHIDDSERLHMGKTTRGNINKERIYERQ